MEFEDMLVKEAKKILKSAQSDVNFARRVGKAYFNQEEFQWNLGKVEGIKIGIKKILKSKGIKQKDFEKKHDI